MDSPLEQCHREATPSLPWREPGPGHGATVGCRSGCGLDVDVLRELRQLGVHFLFFGQALAHQLFGLPVAEEDALIMPGSAAMIWRSML
jgi:hypothetical protein